MPKPDTTAAIMAWLDGIAALCADRCFTEWRTNTTTALWFWYAEGGNDWGRFMIAPEQPAGMLLGAGRFHAGMSRVQIKDAIRHAMARLPILCSDFYAMPPAPRLENAQPIAAPAPTPEPPAASEPPRPANAPEPASYVSTETAYGRTVAYPFQIKLF